MSDSDQLAPTDLTKRKKVTVTHDGREYPLVWDRSQWRLRSRSATHPADFLTGLSNLPLAKQKAREWLEQNPEVQLRSRKGGGSVAALVALYMATPKRTKEDAAKGNVSRLRTICRAVFNRELDAITCRELGPEMWQAYQRAALEKLGKKFDLVTRHKENIAINAAIRSARCLFMDQFLTLYRAEGLDVRQDVARAVPLPCPNLPVEPADEASVLRDWPALRIEKPALWLVIGLARFAGLRRSEIRACRGHWIEERKGSIFVVMRDRPEEGFQTKGGGIYRAQIINAELAEYLIARRDSPEPIVTLAHSVDAAHWWGKAPQRWLKSRGIDCRKPLHRLRGLYADQIAQLHAEAITIKLAADKAAQQALGHASVETTNRHYRTDP